MRWTVFSEWPVIEAICWGVQPASDNNVTAVPRRS